MFKYHIYTLLFSSEIVTGLIMRIQDIADILIMTLLVYQLYIWFRKTRALQVVLGLASVVLMYILTKYLGLFMTSWILQELGTVIFVLIIVVFQGEIRQALYRFSMLRNFFNSNDKSVALDIHNLSNTVFTLAGRQTGALIVIERQERLDDHLIHGVPLDSLVSSQLLESIFENGTPLHDGAVIIRGARLSEASSHLPLSVSGDLPQYLGTRHRAALGLSERTDAIVIVVSEERGAVSVASGGELLQVGSQDELIAHLKSFLMPLTSETGKVSIKDKLFNNLIPKFVTLFLVIVCWLLINAKQGGIQSVTAQVKFHNLPENLVLKNDLPGEIEVQLKVLSTVFSSSKNEISADFDLGKIHEGVNSIPVDSKVFQLPLGVSVAKVTPAVLKIVAEKKSFRDLPITLKKIGHFPGGVRLKSIRIDPSSVRVIGSESALIQLGQIYTEPFDLSSVSKSQVVEVKLLSPSPLIQLKPDEPVKVKLVVSDR
jgi:diadenylate cyclase